MRKLIALLIVTVLLTGLAGCSFAETDPTTITPGLAGIMEYSASEWMSSSTNRATLATFLYLDILVLNHYYDYDDYDVFKTLITRDGIHIYVVIYGNSGSYLLVDYIPSMNKATFGPGEWYGSFSSLKTTCSLVFDSTVYENDADDIGDILEMVQSLISN